MTPTPRPSPYQNLCQLVATLPERAPRQPKVSFNYPPVSGSTPLPRMTAQIEAAKEGSRRER
jgi:hypothetical protein